MVAFFYMGAKRAGLGVHKDQSGINVVIPQRFGINSGNYSPFWRSLHSTASSLLAAYSRYASVAPRGLVQILNTKGCLPFTVLKGGR